MVREKTKLNQLKAGASLSYLSMGISYVISIMYTPVMLRLLGQSQYGLYNLVTSVVSYLGLLNFGFGSAYIRYYSRYKVKSDEDNIAKLNGMFIIIFSALGLMVILVGILLLYNSKMVFGGKLSIQELSMAKVLMVIMIFNMAISFSTIVFNSYVIAQERYVFQKTLQIIKVIGNPLLITPVLILGYGSVGMAIVTTILSILIEFINIFFCLNKLKMKISLQNFDLSLMKEMTVFSSYIFLYMIMDQVLWNTDKFILGRFWGTTTVAIYAIAAQLNTYYMSFSTTISSVFIPRINNIVFSKDEDYANTLLTDLMVRVGRIQFIILSLIMLGLIFFGKAFICIWAGKAYEESYLILLILIIPVTLPLLQNLGIAIQRAKNMQRFLALTNFFIAILNILISIPLAKLYGGVGSAIGTAFAMIIGNLIITNWYYHYRMKLNMGHFWIQIFKLTPSMFPSIFIGLFFLFFVDLYGIVNFILAGIIFTLIYCSSVWKFGMNEFEKALISDPFKRLCGKIKIGF